MHLRITSFEPFEITMPTGPLAPGEELKIDWPPFDVVYGAPKLLKGTGMDVRGKLPLSIVTVSEDGMSIQALVEMLSDSGFASATYNDWKRMQAELRDKPLFDDDLPDALFLLAAYNSYGK